VVVKKTSNLTDSFTNCNIETQLIQKKQSNLTPPKAHSTLITESKVNEMAEMPKNSMAYLKKLLITSKKTPTDKQGKEIYSRPGKESNMNEKFSNKI
jgi:hypothetical protein